MVSRDLWCADLHLLSAPGPGRPPELLCVWWLCASVAIYSIQLCEREYSRVCYYAVPRPEGVDLHLLSAPGPGRPPELLIGAW